MCMCVCVCVCVFPSVKKELVSIIHTDTFYSVHI